MLHAHAGRRTRRAPPLVHAPPPSPAIRRRPSTAVAARPSESGVRAAAAHAHKSTHDTARGGGGRAGGRAAGGGAPGRPAACGAQSAPTRTRGLPMSNGRPYRKRKAVSRASGARGLHRLEEARRAHTGNAYVQCGAHNGNAYVQCGAHTGNAYEYAYRARAAHVAVRRRHNHGLTDVPPARGNHAGCAEQPRAAREQRTRRGCEQAGGPAKPCGGGRGAICQSRRWRPRAPPRLLRAPPTRRAHPPSRIGEHGDAEHADDEEDGDGGLGGHDEQRENVGAAAGSPSWGHAQQRRGHRQQGGQRERRQRRVSGRAAVPSTHASWSGPCARPARRWQSNGPNRRLGHSGVEVQISKFYANAISE